jgi:hypothetical protein
MLVPEPERPDVSEPVLEVALDRELDREEEVERAGDRRFDTRDPGIQVSHAKKKKKTHTSVGSSRALYGS